MLIICAILLPDYIKKDKIKRQWLQILYLFSVLIELITRYSIHIRLKQTLFVSGISVGISNGILKEVHCIAVYLVALSASSYNWDIRENLNQIKIEGVDSKFSSQNLVRRADRSGVLKEF